MALCERTGRDFGLPCTDPYRMGVETILDRLLETSPVMETI